MARGEFRLVAVKNGSKADGTGFSYLGYDVEIVTKPETWIKLEGTAGLHEARVIRHIPERKLLVVKHYGYTCYIDRGSRNQYQPAHIIIYEYVERTVGNEIHLWVDLFGLTQFDLKWKPSLT